MTPLAWIAKRRDRYGKVTFWEADTRLGKITIGHGLFRSGYHHWRVTFPDGKCFRAESEERAKTAAAGWLRMQNGN